MASTKHYERKVSVTIPDVQLRLRQNLESSLGEKARFIEPLRWDEFGLAIEIDRQDSQAVFAELKDASAFKFNMLVDLTAVDWLDKRSERFEVVYQLLSLTYGHRLCVKIRVPEKNPELPSVRPLWHSAWFMEREVFDFYGITFPGNGDMRRILMYDEFVGYPLRKDYPVRAKQPRIPLRIPELRNTADDMRREQLVSLPSRRGVQQPVDKSEVPSE